MSISKLKEDFIQAISIAYEPDEAANIFDLVIEYLTGINLRQNRSAEFTPDGCFIEMFDKITSRLKNNEPVQYILNEAWFYDLPFYVNKAVLIPRPETEELVDWIIKENMNSAPTILDIGTGSGCIPVILKRKIFKSEVFSCDVSEAALSVAEKNARKHKTEITFLHLNFLEDNNWKQLPTTDIIVSNPPYIPLKDKETMQKNVVEYEPGTALFVEDNDPLIFYNAIAKAGKMLLKENGQIYVEIHEDLGYETTELFNSNGYSTTLKKDMQGKNRFVKAVLK